MSPSDAPTDDTEKWPQKIQLLLDNKRLRLRHGSMYDPAIAGPREKKDALIWMKSTIPALRAALCALDPTLPGKLPRYD